jgi:hypothetical protein
MSETVRGREMRRISSRLTFFYKFVVPWPFLALAFLPLCLEHYGSAVLISIRAALLVLYSAWFAYLAWYAIVIKVVFLQDSELLVSDYFRRDRIALNNIVRMQERKLPKYHPIKLCLAEPSLFGSAIYFMPSWVEKQKDLAQRSFWQRFRWHPHPIVNELTKMIAGDGEQEAGHCR